MLSNSILLLASQRRCNFENVNRWDSFRTPKMAAIFSAISWGFFTLRCETQRSLVQLRFWGEFLVCPCTLQEVWLLLWGRGCWNRHDRVLPPEWDSRVSRCCHQATCGCNHEQGHQRTPLKQKSGTAHRCVPPCVAKTCAMRPVFAQVVRDLGAADPRIYSKGPWRKCWSGGTIRGSRTKLGAGAPAAPGTRKPGQSAPA